MAAPVTGGISSGKGGVQVVLEPPLEFILRQTGAFKAALLDLQPLWERFKPVMAALEERWFDGDGDGTWPPLAESTLRYKSGGQILVETGDLRDSLVNPGRAANTGPLQMEWGSDVFYAQYHQEGTPKMPQRQVIPDPFPVEGRRALEAEAVTFINEAARLTFGRIAA